MGRLPAIGVALAMLGACWLTAAAGERRQEVIRVGSRKQLFIDERFIESSRGVTLTMNPPRRDGRVLLAPDQPWEEGALIGVYSSVLEEGGKVRLWYDLIQPTGPGPYDHTRRVCYAESDDGLRFRKVALDLYEVNGSKANNVVLPGVIGGCAVWIDPKAPPEHRYKTQAKVYPRGRFHMHSSPDGIHWKLFAELNPGPGGWDTQSIVFWDPGLARYVLYTRYWFRRSATQPASFRTVRRVETADFKTWENQSIVMRADDLDLADYGASKKSHRVDFYGADVFRYGEADSVYVMLAQAHWHWKRRKPLKGLGPSGFDVRLAVSRDGKTFQRPGGRKPFMRNGPAGSFDSAYVWAMPHPVRMGDELWIYYVGSNRDHNGNLDPAAPKHLSGIGRAVLRLDGFVSADADYTGGELTTPPLKFAGSRLELNVDTGGGGYVWAELLDQAGKPIQGFTRKEAVPVNGNSVRMPVAWRKTSDVSELAGKPVRLRFHMRDCKLYTFQFRK